MDCVSLDFAVEFRHTNDAMVPFWRMDSTTAYLPGRRTTKYPFMGLPEIGNVTSCMPRLESLVGASWPEESADSIHPVYAQAYIPVVKAYTAYGKDNKGKKPFQDHPFLLSAMLGREYISTRREFSHIRQSTEENADYLMLRESLRLQLEEDPRARFEVVVSSRSIGDLLEVDTDAMARHLVGASLLVQVPRSDMVGYCNAVVDELYAPLAASHRGDLEGLRGELSTVLLCESLLAMFHDKGKDMPYSLFRDYDIMPWESGSMARERHLSLQDCARLEGGVLYVPRRRVRRIWVPLEGIG